MSRKKRSGNDRLRWVLAREAARILSEDGGRSFTSARRKAASRIGVSNPRLLPKPSEVLEALDLELRLFRGDRQEATIKRLRLLAGEAMQYFAAFSPRLVGPVLYGTADDSTPIQIMSFADTPEDVAHHLMEQHIPWEQKERYFQYGGSRESHPVFCVYTRDADYEIIVIPAAKRHHPPLSRVTNRPERGANLAEVRRLAEEPDYRFEIGT